MKKLLLALALLLVPNLTQVNAQIFSPGGASGSITVKETDSAPTVTNVQTIQVTNGSLTDNGGGNVTIATNGATNVTIGSSTVTGGTASSFLYVAAGPVLQQVSITGLVLGNGASAPTVYGGGTCTNQVIRVLAGTGAVTCQTIGSTYVDSTVAVTNASNTFTAGVRQTFAPNGTTPGFNFGSNAGDPSTPSNGDCWYNSSTNKFRCRENGVNSDAVGMPDPGANGIVTRTAANTSTNRTITGTSNETLITNGDGVAGNPTIGLATTVDASGKSVLIPHSASLPGTCSTGQIYGADSATTGQRLYYCQSANNWVVQGDGGGGSIGGTTGATDNAILRADGTGGATIQSSGCTISDAGALACSAGVTAGVAGTGVLTMLEGTPPGAGTNVGEHNLYFDSADSKLKSHKNGGSAQTYVRASDTLAVLNTSSSTDLAGVLNDETGNAGGFVRATSPTITTPTFSGIITFPANTRQTFAPGATNAGLNVGTMSGDPGSPSNADMWYDTGTGKLRTREGGTSKDVIPTGAGTGDVTSIIAGTGISCSACGGPDITVNWSPVTQAASFTLFDSANASRTITFGLSGATDPVWTIGDNSMDLTTGVLKVGGSTTATDASTSTFTNKTLDAEGTGNVITIPRRYWFPAAGANVGTAGPVWSIPASGGAVPALVAGTNILQTFLDFADASDLQAQLQHKLSSTFTGTIDATIKWQTTATSGDVVWQIQTICVADAETGDPAFNTASKVTDTAKGTTNQHNDATITGVTITGCAAGELMNVKIRRDAGDAADNLAATARLIGVELVVREAI